MFCPRFLCCCLFSALFLHSQATEPKTTPTAQHHEIIDSWETYSFKIEDSKCRVGIASVKLTVSELVPKDGNLIATYAINVPLSKSSNDTGLIVLPINVSIDELGRNGGVLRGHAYSDKKNKVANTIICEVGPLSTKGITLEITTSERTLHFESQYTVIESPKRQLSQL